MDQDIFAWFVGIGVGHFVLGTGDHVSALDLNQVDEMNDDDGNGNGKLEGDGVVMQEADEGLNFCDEHVDEDEDEDMGEENNSKGSEDEESVASEGSNSEDEI